MATPGTLWDLEKFRLTTADLQAPRPPRPAPGRCALVGHARGGVPHGSWWKWPDPTGTCRSAHGRGKLPRTSWALGTLKFFASGRFPPVPALRAWERGTARDLPGSGDFEIFREWPGTPCTYAARRGRGKAPGPARASNTLPFFRLFSEEPGPGAHCHGPCPPESATRRPPSVLRPPARPGAQYFNFF